MDVRRTVAGSERRNSSSLCAARVKECTQKTESGAGKGGE